MSETLQSSAREHGTTARYQAGCGCDACRRAHYVYGIARERAIVRGEWQPWTDAAEAREHASTLIAAGLTVTNIASIAGVRQGSVYRLLGYGGMPASRRLRPETAAAILAVRADLTAVPRGTLAAAGTRRRLQALVAVGWTQSQLARELGMKPVNLSAMMRGVRGQDTVLASTAEAVRSLYDRLWNRQPPESSRREKIDADRARATARARGWPVPAAWGDSEIDDPDAQPPEGWQRRRRLKGAELAAEARELAGFGLTRAQAAERLGVPLNTLEKTLTRYPEAAEDGEAA